LSGNVIDNTALQAALNPPPPAKPKVKAEPSAGAPSHVCQKKQKGSGEELPLPPASDEEESVQDIFAGMPPHEAFEEGGEYDAGDTFQDFRKWAKCLPVWSLCTAGSLLKAPVRRSIFMFLMNICKRTLYRSQGQEVLRMLLSIEEWTEHDVVDCSALDSVPNLEKADKPKSAVAKDASSARPPYPQVSPPSPMQKCPSPPVQTLADQLVQKLPSPQVSLLSPRATQPAEQHSAPLFTMPKADSKDLRVLIEGVLAGGKRISDGQELIALYRESGLSGGASVSAQAADQEALSVIIPIAVQRLKDFYLEDLHQAVGNASIHIAHLHIDLKQRKGRPLAPDMQTLLENKIRKGERFTSIEKANILNAPHAQTIAYILAYSIARATKAGRNGVWINMGIDTGAQGHANAVILQSIGGCGAFQVFVYDPNFDPEQTHYVHALKAINDQLPKVRNLLPVSSGSISGQAELFGHGLQTALGTTSKRTGWLSRTVITEHRGYPICGSVVQLLAIVWLSVSNGGRLGGPGDVKDIVAVEAVLAEIAAEPSGQDKVRQKIAAILQSNIDRVASRGSDSFEQSMKHRLNKDKLEWPLQFTRHGGSIECSIAERRRSYTYTW